MSKIIKITAFFLFFVMCFCVKNAFAIPEINPDIEPILKFWPTLAECQANCIGICTEFSGISIDGSTPMTNYRCEGGIDVEPNLPDFPIWESCGTSGTTQSKYTASGCTYETESRECCSNGRWSIWNGNCPKTCNNADKPNTTRSCTASNGNTGTQTRSVTCDTTTGEWVTGTWGTCTAKTCSQSTKPDTVGTCYGGTRTRTVTCSNGSWQTGAWGSCSCTDAGFEKVPLIGGGTCCQKTDGTGARCNTGVAITYSWQSGGEVYCNGGGVSNVSACGTCNNYGQQCKVIISNGFHLGMEEADSKCMIYTCR